MVAGPSELKLFYSNPFLTTEAGSFTLFPQTKGNLFDLRLIFSEEHPAATRTRLRKPFRRRTPPEPCSRAAIRTLAEVEGELQADAEEGLAAGALQHVTLHVGPAVPGANQGRQLVGFARPLQRVLPLRIKPNRPSKLRVEQGLSGQRKASVKMGLAGKAQGG